MLLLSTIYYDRWSVKKFKYYLLIFIDAGCRCSQCRDRHGNNVNNNVVKVKRRTVAGWQWPDDRSLHFDEEMSWALWTWISMIYRHVKLAAVREHQFDGLCMRMWLIRGSMQQSRRWLKVKIVLTVFVSSCTIISYACIQFFRSTYTACCMADFCACV